MRCGTLAVAAATLLVALSGCVEEAETIPLDAVNEYETPEKSESSGEGRDADRPANGVDGEAARNETAPEGTETRGGNNGTLDGNGTVDVGPVPTALLSASATDGVAPLNVSFAVDQEGNATSWTLDLGDGTSASGDTFPATVEHTYEEGTFDAALTVVDEAGNNGTATVRVVVEGSEFPWEDSRTQMLLCAACGEIETADGCVGWAAGQNGMDCVWFSLPEGSAGRTFTLTSDVGDPDLEFYEACTFGSPFGPAYAAAGKETGTVPEGMGCIVAWEWRGFASTLTLTIA